MLQEAEEESPAIQAGLPLPAAAAAATYTDFWKIIALLETILQIITLLSISILYLNQILRSFILKGVPSMVMIVK